ncbi:MAG: hypothetical protein K2I30_06280 [Clostridia bacterium]|nr:hypothetical protein [Clostridia bacterium]
MDDLGKVCSCFGHLDFEITKEIENRTWLEIKFALCMGVRTFLFGGRSTFDDLCYKIVTKIKKQFPVYDIKRVFCFPLAKHLKSPPPWYKPKEYEKVVCPLKKFDGWYRSLFFRNMAMIDRSEIVLFCVEERENSGAFKTYKYALSQHKEIVNVLLK